MKQLTADFALCSMLISSPLLLLARLVATVQSESADPRRGDR
jgi:hypothetical protein